MAKKAIPVLLIVFVVVLHFVPLYNKTGFIDHKVCIGYEQPVPTYFRLIPDGLSEFRETKQYLMESVADEWCAQPVKLRLYLW